VTKKTITGNVPRTGEKGAKQPPLAVIPVYLTVQIGLVDVKAP